MGKLRTVLLYSSGHLGSATVLNNIVDMPEFELLCVVKSEQLTLTRGSAKKIKKYFKKVGWRFGWLLLWQQLIQIIGYAVNLILPGRENRIRPAWNIGKRYHIPVRHYHDINDAAAVKYIKDLKPDLIVSAYFNQILKEAIINIPLYGTLNIHPGWLPAYRGAMAYFWVLKNGSDSAGVSIHWIDKGIDTGMLISRRKFTITAKMTQQKVLVLTAVIGVKLLQRVARTLLAGDTPVAITSETAGHHYYSVPGEKDFDEYFKRRRFFRIRELLSFLFRPRAGR